MDHELLPVNFDRAAKLYANLIKLPTADSLSYKFSGKVFRDICNAIANTLSTQTRIVDVETIQSTLSSYMEQPVTTDLLHRIYAYVSHNVIDLMKNKACPPLKPHPDMDEFLSCVQVRDIMAMQNTVFVLCECVWGTAYGLQPLYAIKKEPSDILESLLYKSGVNSRRNSDGETRDLVDCCFYARLWTYGPKASLNCSGFNCSDYLKGLNRRVYRERQKPCVFDYPLRCVECPIGKEICSRSTRQKTHESIADQVKPVNLTSNLF